MGGTKEGFERILHKYLSIIPDQPEIDNLMPEAKTTDEKPSNSIVDWTRGSDYLAILMKSKEVDHVVVV